jgi:MoaA/NifB/PqqE/SkfB family radical SAM enzyme
LIEERIKIIKSLGNYPFWITIGGGEPFIRNDLKEIILAIDHYNKPNTINIPTNGLLKIHETLEDILDELREDVKFTVNFSIDELFRYQNYIRGVPNNWKRIIKTYKETKKLKNKYPNLSVGINTVISRWNVKRFPKIQKYLIDKLKPDNYITEIAQIRNEMKNYSNSPAPSSEDYENAINILIKKIEDIKFKGREKIIQAFRLEYYKYVKNFQHIKSERMKSYAGFASCYISPIGDVWDCATYGSNIGNLRDFDCNFKKLWNSERASKIREEIKRYHECILANEFYSNVLFDVKRMIKIFGNLVKFSSNFL